MHEKKLILLIALLTFLTPLYQALTNLRISLSHPETQIVIGIAVLLSLASGFVSLCGNQKIKIAALSLLAFVFFDLAIEYRDIIINMIPGDYAGNKIIRKTVVYSTLVITIAVIYFIFWNLRRTIVSILAVFFSVVMVATIVKQPLPKLTDSMSHQSIDNQNTPEPGKTDSPDLPIVLHIIFDELLSPSAIDLDIDGGRELHKNMLELSEQFDFRLYGRVYGRHYFSAVSMPNMMNGEYKIQTSGQELNLSQNTRLSENAYFDDMHNRGYKIAVYQTSHINFCENKHVAICNTFDSFDPMWQVDWESHDRSREKKLGYLWLVLLRGFDGSYTSRYIKKLSINTGELPESFDVPGFPLWFDNFMGSVTKAQRGTLIFAHFMAPHAPYLLTKECEVRLAGDPAGYYLGKKLNFNNEAMDTARSGFYKEYFSQSNCVFNKLTQLLEVIGKLDKFNDATIIIHGDHGSRISVGNHVEDYSQRDFVDNYATFYAIRAPDITTGYDCSLISLPQLFSEHIQANQELIDRERSPFKIYVDSKIKSGKYTEANMPEFQCNIGS